MARTDKNGDRRRLLECFEPRRRGHIANLFLLQVRQGKVLAKQIADGVSYRLRLEIARNQRYRNFSTVQRKQEILTILESHPEEAIDFARWAVWWESLSDEEKEAIKSERGAFYRDQYLDSQPPTEKQIRYLRHLGWTGEVKSKLHASELIDQLLKNRR